MAARKQKLAVSEKDIIAAAGCQTSKYHSACNLMREISEGQYRRVHRGERVAHR
jgi:hypothetical protein